MSKVLLDTDILSEYLKGNNPVVAQHAAAYLTLNPTFTITSITVYEIAYGLSLKGAQSQLNKALTWLGRNEEITPTAADYKWAATVKASARNLGLIVELPDCLIAAAAVRLAIPLVTGNTADYESIQKTGVPLQLLNWRLL